MMRVSISADGQPGDAADWAALVFDGLFAMRAR